MARAIERTTSLFVRSVREAIPEAKIQVQRSVKKHGRSNYVYIDLPGQFRGYKVRISDHPVGMMRALHGSESLYVNHLAKPDSWAVWLSKLPGAGVKKEPLMGGSSHNREETP